MGCSLINYKGIPLHSDGGGGGNNLAVNYTHACTNTLRGEVPWFELVLLSAGSSHYQLQYC